MERRLLGKSGLAISRVGIGTAPIGSVPGVWWVNWGAQDERDSIRAIHAAVDAGVNWIDTAPFYAEHGLGVIVWAPLASGFLTDGFAVGSLEEDDFRRTHPFAAIDLEKARAELRSLGGTSTRGAIRWVLSKPRVTGAIVGVRNEREGRELGSLGSAV